MQDPRGGCPFCGAPTTEEDWPRHAREAHGEILRQLCDWHARH